MNKIGQKMSKLGNVLKLDKIGLNEQKWTKVEFLDINGDYEIRITKEIV